jgi:hypothetical protein
MKSYSKQVECPVCKTQRIVRKDSASVTCKSCAGRKGAAAALVVIRAKTKVVPCKTCGKPIPARLGYTYCSVACRVKGTHEDRTCKYCGTSFSVWKSSIAAGTNASGNFCSRACYEKWLCRTDRVTGRGSQWSKSRKEALRRVPFCAVCGTRRGLQVHHLAPFRLNYDNRQSNLITLCVKHHKIVESLTNEIESTGSDPETMTLVMGNILRSRAQVTASVINRIANAGS